MNKDIIREALEYGRDISYETTGDELFENALAEVNKSDYYPLGQEPVNQKCLSCGLNCPNDCPLDKEEAE